MMFGRRRPIRWATGAAMVCLLGMMTARVSARSGAVALAEAAQAGPAQAPLMTENLFRNIQVLKGIPVDTFFDVMGMFASSMGEDCTFCHSKEAVFRHEAFGDLTPKITRARQMIAMMKSINETNFGGRPLVTCFTCHRGSNSPVNAPRLSLQYGPPDDDPNVINFPADTGMSADQILDRYLQALGGTGQLARLSSFAAKGTYSGFDTAFKEVPVDIYAKAPNQRTWIIHMPEGDSRRVFDGRNGWWAGPDGPAPIETLTSGNLDRYRLEAIVAFPAGIKQAFSRWKVGRTAIDDRAVHIVQGTNPASRLLPVNLYFDNTSGLLVRWVRWNETPVGPVPTQIDYDDYRDVAGVRMPFTWTVSQTYMQMTIKLSGIQANVPVDPAMFAEPAPATPKP
jgi:photosynthetic reaction center cytochrome c subunit